MHSALRCLVAFLFLSGAFSVLRAQDDTKLSYGICGGLNQANFQTVEGSRVFPVASMNAPQLGLFLEGVRHNHMNLRVELNYRRKSDDLFVSNPGMAYPMSWDGHYNLDYISMILLPELRLGDRVEWLLNGGIYLGGLVNASFYRQTRGPTGNRVLERENVSSHFPSMDGGFVVGSGLNFHINEKWQLGVQVRWMRTVPSENVQSADYGALISLCHSLRIYSGSKLDKFLN